MSDKTLIKVYLKRRSQQEWEIKRNEVASLLKAGLIEPSALLFSTLVVYVKKKDNKIQFCINYQRINHKIIFDSYPIRRIEEHLEMLSGCSYFTTIDLTKGYFQMSLDLSNKEYTTFKTSLSLF